MKKNLKKQFFLNLGQHFVFFVCFSWTSEPMNHVNLSVFCLTYFCFFTEVKWCMIVNIILDTVWAPLIHKENEKFSFALHCFVEKEPLKLFQVFNLTLLVARLAVYLRYKNLLKNYTTGLRIFVKIWFLY